MTSPGNSTEGGPADGEAVTSSGLPFQPQEMVDWLHPRQLATTAIKAVVSGIFGAYADKRELQAALHPWNGGKSPYDADYSDESGQEFWFDFAADVGDGFSSTYSIAWLLAQDQLTLPNDESGPLRRGRFLVLGGDEVYPTASREAYQNRFRGPYESAFPGDPGPQDPNLFAVPGNHDWYDGLTSFTRLFCQSRGIGRWKTRQTRSYFAIKLPNRWWLWGVDIQLESDIDRPQMEFFRAVAEEMSRECTGGPPPRLILCTGQPSWTECGAERTERRGLRHAEPRLFDNQAFFEDRIVRHNGIRLMVTLSGDLHHFMRYEQETGKSEDKVQRITSGGGGAYLYPTHHMPNAIELPEGGERVRYQQKLSMFPSAADSHRLARGIALLPFRNRAFTFFLGAVYLLYAWTLQSASKSHPVCQPLGRGGTSLMECIQPLGLGQVGQVFGAFGRILQHSPSNVVFALVLIFGLYQFRAAEDESWTRWIGAAHGAAHLVLSALLIWAISQFDLGRLGLGVDDPVQALLFALLMLVGGGIAGAWLFALYLWSASKNHGCHLNEVFSSQHIADYKNFLRLRIAPDGVLTIHAVGVPAVPKRGSWVRRKRPDPVRPLFDPPGGTIAARRIDGPTHCR
jgi:hypothetical protein